MSPERFDKAIGYMYTQLNADNSTHRSHALLALFTHKKDDVLSMKMIEASDDTLIYKGSLSASLQEQHFNYFKAGNFAYDPCNKQFPEEKLLIIGRTTVPSLQEYAAMKISVNLLKEVTSDAVAYAFAQAVKKAETENNSTN